MSKNEPVANNYSANTKCCGPEMLTLTEENKMIRKGLIYLVTTLIILLLVSLAIATIPPPPADQSLGLYDTVFTGFTTEECKNEACHGDENIPDRHHLLITEGYNCVDLELGCHSLTDGIFDPFRNCSDCHLISPHHVTEDAENFNCSECHGDFVDDYEDGHVIPNYAKTNITPNSSFKYINDTTGLKIGGCEACHEPDLDADPQIRSNADTHHNLNGFSLNNCRLCHSSDGPEEGTPGDPNLDVGLDIRYCERCHGINSLHSIQYEDDSTSGAGYGHIGDNWDCWGCHGWLELDIYSTSSLSSSSITTSEGNQLPGNGATVPHVDKVDPSAITAGQDTGITIYGSSFENEYNGVNHTSNVTLDNGTVTIVLEPDSITSTVIEVTINRTLESDIYDLRVVKDGVVESNKVTLTVISEEQVERVIRD